MKKQAEQAKPFSAASMREWYAMWAANRYAELYCETGNGLFVWKAYQELREARVPVPEPLMVALDGIAERLMTANSARDVASALRMSKRGGGPAGAAHAQQLERLDAIVREVNTLMNMKGLKPEEAYRYAAENLRETPDSSYPSVAHVKAEYTKWKAAVRAQSGMTGFDTLATFGRK